MIVRKACEDDVHEIVGLINGVDEEKSVFIKSTSDEVRCKIDGSIVCFDGSVMVGACLVEGGYIDTIVSCKKGVGRFMLLSLPSRKYSAHISKYNEKSLRLFGGLGFIKAGNEEVCGEERGVYEGCL